MKLSRLSFIVAVLFLSITILAQSETKKGVELYRNGDYDSALAVLESVVQADKKDRKAWVYLGASFVKKGKDKEAGKAFRAAKSISNPEKTVIDSEQIKIISKPRANTQEVPKEERINGRISLAVEFKSDGKIGFVIPIMNTLSYSLTKNAIYAAQGIKFEPPQKNGKPITMIKFVEYDFTFF